MANGPSDYVYDVFFSYKRNPMSASWNRWVYDQLRFWLTEELGGRPANIFMDERDIEAGEIWPKTIQEAIRHSRCLVCVWQPSYFQSSWCVSEWRSFRAREGGDAASRTSLIAPLVYHDGEHFPKEAQDTQSCDVSTYASTLRAFLEGPKMAEFEDVLKSFSKRVAAMVTNAPPFDPNYPIVPARGFEEPKIGLERL